MTPSRRVPRVKHLAVNLFVLTMLPGGVGAVAGEVQLVDDKVVHHTVYDLSGGHGLGEDVLPFHEDRLRVIPRKLGWHIQATRAASVSDCLGSTLRPSSHTGSLLGVGVPTHRAQCGWV